MNNEAINNLREALKFSPDNVPLRLHLADVLMSEKMYAEAEAEYKFTLEVSVGNSIAKQGLAKSCFLQNKFSLAFVVLEEICRKAETPAEYHILFSKILLKDGMKEQAQQQYKTAIDKDKNSSDPELDKHFRMASLPFEEEESEEIEKDELEKKLMVEKPNVKFEDVGGMKKVKEEIQLKIIHPLTHPQLYKAYGKKIGGGILLYGPPGCGKTHIARATAGEVNAKFISIGINDILDMWIGSSEKNLHGIFELARRNTPCVLFIDEVDALGANRSDMKNSSGRHLINQFLNEMDGIDASNEGVLILAATNAPWHLDPAFRRPGRFDRIIFVQPPDEESREQILNIELKEKPVTAINAKEVASKTAEFSGADIKALIDVVIEEKLRASFKTGIPEAINQKDILSNISKVIPSTKEWFTIARNYALYSNESGLYDDILAYLKIKK